MSKQKENCDIKCKGQWLLSGLVFVVIAVGWKYPVLGFFVPLTMAAGMVGGLLGNGRWVCGNLCPRGNFWDRPLSKVIKNQRPSPAWLKNLTFRWIVFVALIGFMFFRASANFSSLMHWGKVFWLMCTVTTGIGLVGSLFYHRRFWCVFCPIGTFASTVSGNKNQLSIDDEKCVSCHLCDKACPIAINPEQYRKEGKINDRDCLRCSRCINTCPKQAISN